MSASTTAAPAETGLGPFDLTGKIGSFLDRHLLLRALELVEERKLYPAKEKEILSAKLDVLSKTNMVDFAKDIYTKLNGADAPKEMDEKREKVIAELQKLQEEAAPLVDLLDVDAFKQMREAKQLTFSNAQSQFNITEANVKSLYKWAKFQYDIGNYSGAADCLSVYRDLSNDNETATAALWGILSAQILADEWDAAAEDLKTLRERIDSNTFASPVSQLQQRTWLLHWGLFVFFNHPQGRVQLVDLFFSEKMMNTIQTTSPHLLRYLAVAVITTKKRRAQLKDLIKAIEQESYHYSDPITEFVEALFIQCDFAAAEQALRAAEEVLSRDIFLGAVKEEFTESARMFIFETYCKIHSCLDINLLAQKLSLNAEEAERWIVNLIRNARLDAKIDSQANQILLGANTTSPYQQLIDKTKGLALRSVVLSNNIERARHNTQKKQQQQQQQRSEEVAAK